MLVSQSYFVSLRNVNREGATRSQGTYHTYALADVYEAKSKSGGLGRDACFKIPRNILVFNY